jgi:hypothetical protein
MHEMLKCTLLKPCPLCTYAICFEWCKRCINLSGEHAARYVHKESISRPYVPWVDYSEHNYWGNTITTALQDTRLEENMSKEH